MKEEKEDIAICYIHKIAMKEIEQQEPIPEYGYIHLQRIQMSYVYDNIKRE